MLVVSFVYFEPWIIFELIKIQTADFGMIVLEEQNFDLMFYYPVSF